jgi:hypothetical protein
MPIVTQGFGIESDGVGTTQTRGRGERSVPPQELQGGFKSNIGDMRCYNLAFLHYCKAVVWRGSARLGGGDEQRDFEKPIVTTKKTRPVKRKNDLVRKVRRSVHGSVLFLRQWNWIFLDIELLMEKISTKEIKEMLPISQCLLHLGFKPKQYRYQFHCIYHKANSARDDRGTATCMAGCFENLDQFNSIKKARNQGFLESKKQAILIIGREHDMKPRVSIQKESIVKHYYFPKT